MSDTGEIARLAADVVAFARADHALHVLLDAVSRMGLVDELVRQLQLAQRSENLIDLVRIWHPRH